MLEANAMDFDDLLMRAVNVLELFEDVRERYQERFRWILVDEYQDTNRAQYRLLQLLSGKHGNLTVVGDDSQAIYGFRGADVRNILEFEKDFPDAAVVKLEQNYRSTQTILSAANGVIANNPSNLDKNLWTEAGEGEKIVVAQLDDEHAEARFVAGEIEGLVTDEGFTARPDRGLLPDQRDEPGARGHPGPLRAALPGDRRDEVLRARRDQGRDRLPPAAGQPRRRGQLLAGDQLAAPRDRRHEPGPADLAREHDRPDDLGGGARARGGPGARAPPRSSPSAASPS